MSRAEDEKPPKKLSELLRTSWIRSSINAGLVFIAIGLIVLFILKSFNIGSTQLISDAKAFVKEYWLIGIFFATVLAGTVVPLGSPALVVAAAVLDVPRIPLILVATTGFTVGMSVNYGLAYRLGRPYIMRKVSGEKLGDIVSLWNKWGWLVYTIFGFIPVLPVELLSFVCGLLKTRVDVFLILSFLPRLIVFTILAYFGEHIGVWIGIV